MKSLYIKDKNKRKLFLINENKKIVLKSLLYNLNFKRKLRYRAFLNLMKFPLLASITRINNRCTLTNRPRAVYRHFKMSRLMFRKMALQGKLIGVRKAS
jgi:small subunit ribosomal protein S14